MADYSVDVENSGTLDVTSDVTLEGLDDIKVDTTLHGGTSLTSESDVSLKSDATARLTLDPVTTSSSVAMDLEPVAVDSCVRVVLAPLPPTVVRSPWEQRVGFSWLGVEVAAITWCGESRTHLEPEAARPLVVPGDRAEHRAGTHDGPGPEHRRPGGVQIRVGS